MGHLDEVLVELAVVPAVAELEAVVLDLQVEVVAEETLEPARPLVGVVELPVEHVLLDDALDAGALADEPLVVLLEHREGGTRAVVHHLVAGGLGHAPDEVDVARLVLGEKDQVVATLLGAPLDAVVGDEVGLAPEDGLDLEPGSVGLDRGEVMAGRLPHRHVGRPLVVDAIEVGGALRVGLGLVEGPPLLEALEVMTPAFHVLLAVVVLSALEVEVGDTEHVSVVGEGYGGHAEVVGALHHVWDARGAVEYREVRVIVEVHEGHGSSWGIVCAVRVFDTS